MGLPQRVVLHGLQHRWLRQQQPGALQLLLPLAGQLFRRDIPFHAQNLVPGGQIQHASRFDLMAKVGLSLFLQGEQIEEHLDIQPHLHRRQVEGLFARLVVHHPQIQLAVLYPTVHPVHLAADSQLSVRLRYHHSGQRAVVAEGQLKFQGDKVRMPQFLCHLVDDGIGRVPQTGKEILKPGVSLPEIVQFLLHIQVNVVPDQLMQLLVIHRREASHAQHIPGDVFQQEVEESADLRRVKGSRGPGLRLQAVLHEVGEVAGAHTLQPGGGHGHPITVQCPDSAPGQTAPLDGRCPLHGCQAVRKLGIFREIPPQRPLRPLSRCLQRGDGCC